MKLRTIFIAPTLILLISGLAAPAIATAPPEITFGNISGTIMHDSDPQSDTECASPLACDSFKLVASFTISDNVDLVADLAASDAAIEFVLPGGSPCTTGTNLIGIDLPAVTMKTSKGKTVFTGKGLSKMFRGSGPATNVPVVFSVTVNTAKNSGVIKISAQADFTGLDVSPLDFHFFFHQNETADGDLDSVCGSLNATLKNAH